MRLLDANLLSVALLTMTCGGGCHRAPGSNAAAPVPATVNAAPTAPLPATPRPTRRTPLPTAPGRAVPSAAAAGNPNEVRVQTGDVSVTTFLPLQKLTEAIKAEHKRQQFHIAWTCDVAGSSSQGVAVYDRRKKTLDYTLTTTAAAKSRKRHLLFSGVTDAVLTRLAHDYPGGGPDAGFESLPAYGCRETSSQ